MSKLRLENVSYKYEKSRKNVLQDLSYEFENGNIYAIVGKSGAGKTTLLSLLSGLTKPTSGHIYLDGNDTAKKDMYVYRSRDVGVIFQSFNLLPKLTALENVILSMDVSGKKFKDKKFAAKCNREVIKQGCEMLGMEIREVAEICIEAMKAYAEDLQLGPKV